MGWRLRQIPLWDSRVWKAPINLTVRRVWREQLELRTSMICWPAHWQRFDTVHSVATESGQLHAGRQTRLTFQEENKTALRRANQKQMRQQDKF